jgi:hypothetical protein
LNGGWVGRWGGGVSFLSAGAATPIALQEALRARPEPLGEAETSLMIQWLARVADS